jgi:hypothetical protein
MLEDLDKVEGEVCFLESTVRSMGHGWASCPSNVSTSPCPLADARRIEQLEADLAELTVVDSVVGQAVQKALADLRRNSSASWKNRPTRPPGRATVRQGAGRSDARAAQ